MNQEFTSKEAVAIAFRQTFAAALAEGVKTRKEICKSFKEQYREALDKFPHGLTQLVSRMTAKTNDIIYVVLERKLDRANAFNAMTLLCKLVSKNPGFNPENHKEFKTDLASLLNCTLEQVESIRERFIKYLEGGELKAHILEKPTRKYTKRVSALDEALVAAGNTRKAVIEMSNSYLDLEAHFGDRANINYHAVSALGAKMFDGLPIELVTALRKLPSLLSYDCEQPVDLLAHTDLIPHLQILEERLILSNVTRNFGRYYQAKLAPIALVHLINPEFDSTSYYPILNAAIESVTALASLK